MQAGFELTILSPLPSESWDFECKPHHLLVLLLCSVLSHTVKTGLELELCRLSFPGVWILEVHLVKNKYKTSYCLKSCSVAMFPFPVITVPYLSVVGIAGLFAYCVW